MKIRLIVAGSRDFDDYKIVKNVMEGYVNSWISMYDCNRNDIEIISGGCRGVDLLGEKYAKEFNHPLKVFTAEWGKYGKAAGPIRNKIMAEYAAEYKNAFLIAFWDGLSNGTKNMVSQAEKYGLHIITYKIRRNSNE